MYTKFIQSSFGSAAPSVAERYPLSAFNDTKFPAFYAMSDLLTDVEFKCPAYRGLDGAVQNGVGAFAYSWAHTPFCPWFPAPEEAFAISGPTHTAEIPFVFAHTENLPPPNGNCNFTREEQDISARMVSAWSSMAATGNPSNQGLQWPEFEPSTLLGVNINSSVTAGSIDFSNCDFWDSLDAAELRNASLANNASTAGNWTAGSGTASGIVARSVKPPTTDPRLFTGAATNFGGNSISVTVVLATLGAVLILLLPI